MVKHRRGIHENFPKESETWPRPSHPNSERCSEGITGLPLLLSSGFQASSCREQSWPVAWDRAQPLCAGLDRSLAAPSAEGSLDVAQGSIISSTWASAQAFKIVVDSLIEGGKHRGTGLCLQEPPLFIQVSLGARHTAFMPVLHMGVIPHLHTSNPGSERAIHWCKVTKLGHITTIQVWRRAGSG